MIRAGLWVPRRLRAPKIQQPRYRRACAGELIQIDGCDHHWFEYRAPPCTLLVYVDDATSRLMHLRFVLSESTFSYFEATRGYLEKHCKPLALYSDKASVFRINNKNATGGDSYTQFSRAMYELNIKTICAETSSAKGRVERAHLTLIILIAAFHPPGVSSPWDQTLHSSLSLISPNRSYTEGHVELTDMPDAMDCNNYSYIRVHVWNFSPLIITQLMFQHAWP